MNKNILVLSLISALTLQGCSYLPSWAGGKEEAVEKLEGDRISVLQADGSLQPDESVSKLPFTLPSAVQNGQWPQHSGNVTAANSNLSIRGALGQVASSRIGDAEGFVSTLVTPPVVAEGLVFAMDASGHVTAHEADNISRIRWESEGTYEEDAPETFGGGLAYDHGVLYALSGRGEAVALDAATGQMLWRKSMHLPFRSAPKVSKGRLFATTLDNQLYVLKASNGAVLWTHRGIEETTNIMSAVSPAVAGEIVIVPYSSGELYALSVADGREIWRDTVSPTRSIQSSALFAGIGGDPVIDGEVVFAATTSGMLTVLHIGGGQHIWERQIGSLNTPWISGDYAYLLTTDNILVSLVKYNGKIRWSLRLPSFEDEEDKEGTIVWSGPVMVDGALLVAGSRGQLARIDASDGKLLTMESIPDEIYTSPVVADGRMYLVGRDATLYSFE